MVSDGRRGGGKGRANGTALSRKGRLWTDYHEGLKAKKREE